MGAIYRRELGSFFNSAIGPVFLTVFYLGSGVLFWLFCLNYARTDMSNYFAWMRLVMVLILPLLTMRLLSEERAQKTDQGLLTAPVSLGGIVLGKYLAPHRLCHGHCHCLCLCHSAELLRHGCMVDCLFQLYRPLPHGSSVHGNHPVFVCIHSKPVHRLCFGHCFSGCPLYDRLPERNSFQQCRFSFQQKHCPQHPCGLARQCDGIGFILQPHL